MNSQNTAKNRIGLTVLTGEQGHINAFSTVARRLSEAGFEVTFIGLIDEQSTFEKMGFQYIPILPDKLPVGRWQQLSMEVARTRGMFARLLKIQKLYRYLEDLLFEFSSQLEGKFDLIIADALLYHGPLVAAKAGIPVLLLETTLPFKNPFFPDLASARTLKPDGTLSLYCKYKKSRLSEFLTLNPKALLFKLANGLVGLFASLKHQSDVVRFGINLKALPVEYDSFEENYGSIVACPQCFEFDRRCPPRYFYIDALMNQGQDEDPFDWSQIPTDKAIIYASMGSRVGKMGEQARQIYQLVMDAFGSQKDVFVIIAAGDMAETLRDASDANNVLFLDWAPQKAILKRAELMITHAGLNSIKECIDNEVPMICFPAGRDQPGNAVRVSYHRLGFVARQGRTDVTQLREMAKELRQNPVYRLSLKRMKQGFDAAAKDNALVEIVTHAIG